MEIISKVNPKIKKIAKLLKDGQLRQEENIIIIDGQREIEEAIKNNWEIEEFFYCPNFINKKEEDKKFNVKTISSLAKKVFELSEQAFNKISYKKMFGEYGIYCNDKFVAVVCDNKLYVKPTAAGRKYIGKVIEAKPYPTASPRFLIKNKIKDSKWLAKLIKITSEALS